MEDLLGLLVPIIGVILWVVGMFNSKNDEQQPKSKPVQKVPQANTRKTQPVKSSEKQTAYASELDSTSFQDQKKQQMDRLKESIQSSESLSKKQKELLENSPIKQVKRPAAKKQPTLSVKNNLTRKGVAQGIIMAEVLGKPRAYKKRSY
ncbi:hypothetical protein F9U64_18800 [Gracilibacillus oryzae]|uniref:Uncharacterized protein n=1 Tax=Gracilibacillus oryzae TaxID=1672701 RepID=A0A7C8GRA2_9BACI|nr:hypothetical protein [Gracilibacillus oryzae]KAB8126872.1 hypothetical protein F9U64_18800 [Gracilibacillus oryzae]